MPYDMPSERTSCESTEYMYAMGVAVADLLNHCYGLP
eukprot:SAG31_NODE_33366_length_344_cov_1.228571_1_plen_36_part_10